MNVPKTCDVRTSGVVTACLKPTHLPSLPPPACPTTRLAQKGPTFQAELLGDPAGPRGPGVLGHTQPASILKANALALGGGRKGLRLQTMEEQRFNVKILLGPGFCAKEMTHYKQQNLQVRQMGKNSQKCARLPNLE